MDAPCNTARVPYQSKPYAAQMVGRVDLTDHDDETSKNAVAALKTLESFGGVEVIDSNDKNELFIKIFAEGQDRADAEANAKIGIHQLCKWAGVSVLL